MIAAYADPPYPGESYQYVDHPDYDGEVDHPELIGRLVADYEAYALSTKSSALRDLLPLFPAEARVAPWCKPFCSWKPGNRVAWTWEPVIFYTPRVKSEDWRDVPTVRDHHSENITLKKGLSGVKPPGFCRWLFDLLGLTAGDELCDLFPGSNAVGEAWVVFRSTPRLTYSKHGEGQLEIAGAVELAPAELPPSSGLES